MLHGVSPPVCSKSLGTQACEQSLASRMAGIDRSCVVVSTQFIEEQLQKLSTAAKIGLIAAVVCRQGNLMFIRFRATDDHLLASHVPLDGGVITLPSHIVTEKLPETCVGVSNVPTIK